MKRTVHFLLSLAALALFIPVGSALAAKPPDAATVPKLLDQIKHHAAEVNRDAAVLDSYRFTPISWQSYATTLNGMKDHANALFQDYYVLRQMKDKATPSQQKAIDRLEPLLRELATSLTNTIQSLNKHPADLRLPEFQDRVRTNAQKVNAVYEFMCKCTNKNLAI